MIVSFDMHTPSTGNPDKDVPTEYVRMDYKPEGTDVLHRKATEDDKVKYAEAYTAFKGPAPKKGLAKLFSKEG